MKNNINLSSLSVDEVQEKLAIERATLQKLEFAHAITPIENPLRVRTSRRMIARLLTELRAREIANVN